MSEAKIHITETGMRAFCGRVVSRRVSQANAASIQVPVDDFCSRCARSFLDYQRRTEAKAAAKRARRTA